jgi:hypothetical protein
MSYPPSFRSSFIHKNSLHPFSNRNNRRASQSTFFLNPLLQEVVFILTSITTTMSHIPTSLLNLLGLSRTPTSPSPQNMSSMMRELVMDQQRTMFYTVTMSPTQQKTQDIKRTITPSLKVGNVIQNQI